jgi:HEAT repeat protein/DNA polymerase III delta prime subunit
LRQKATEKGFEINVHVPLGLVERKEQPRRSMVENAQMGEVYQLEKEVISQIYEHDEFLQQVIGQTPTGRNNHVAIIGEPGAGKTTLLGAIASFILDRNPTPSPSPLAERGEKNSTLNPSNIEKRGENLAIFISLASLQGRTLENYILKTWLFEAMGLVHPEVVLMPKIENQLQHQLKQRFQQGGVWLLLDGVDEMGLNSSAKALSTIQKQLTSWLTPARVALTCRLNVWDASLNNPLSGFDTYKTQDFQSEDIDKFIKTWFGYDKPERGEQLQAKLKETGRERICELVKNPLRLSLLCQIFYLDKQAELPKTKAGLYHKFVRYFYEWKQKDGTNQKELHSALGKLALAGINSVARFRLSESLANQEMGKEQFKLACDLGWLNLVNRDAETDEAVYAFFHPTFQEYFAACAISNWDFFLPREHKNKPVKDKPYRIFEPQWKEVILLWLGRENVEKQQKEQFLNALVGFKDGCNNFYLYKAYFLAAVGIVEFKDYPEADKIVKRIVSWIRQHPIEEEVKLVIQQTERIKGIAIVTLVALINNSQDEYTCRLAAYRLGKIDKDNPIAIAALVKLIDNYQNEYPPWYDKHNRNQAAACLLYIGKNSSTAIAALVKLIDNSQDEYTHEQAALILGAIGKENPKAIDALVKLIDNSQDESTRLQAAASLGKIDKDNLKAIAALVELIHNSQKKSTRWQATASLGKIDKDNPKAIAALVELIDKSQDKSTRWQAASSLCEIGKYHPKAIAALVELIDKFQDKSTRRQTASSLEKIGKDNRIAIDILVKLIHNSQDKSTRRQAAESLGEIGKYNQKAITALVELIHNSRSKYTHRKAASILGEIGKDNRIPIDTLVELIDKSTYSRSASSLRKIGKDNPKAIAALVELIDNSQYKYTHEQAASILGKIGKDNPIAIAGLVKLIDNQDKSIRWQAAISLSEIDKDNPKAIAPLVELVTNSQFEYTHSEALSSLWNCVQNTPYPTFYQAWQQGRGGVFNRLLIFIKHLPMRIEKYAKSVIQAYNKTK